MPKTGIFNDMIQFSSFLEQRERIIAMQFYRGDRDFSETARAMMEKGLQCTLDSMEPRERRQYEQVLENAKAMTAIRVQEREERIRKRSRETSELDS